MMRNRYFQQACVFVALETLAGCGGGGGSGSNAVPIVTGPAPTPTLAVTLSAPSADVNVDEGQTATFGFVASYSGASTQPIVPNVTIGGKRYALEGTPTASGNGFAVSLKTASFAPGGKASSTVTFRLCTSADCATVYPGSTASYTVNLDVRLKDWGTAQRDAAHSGYVAVKYTTADFADAWNVAGTPSARTSQIAARRGSIFFNVQSVQGGTNHVLTRALNTATGAQAWEYDLGQRSYFSAPSYANGRVISAAMDISSGNIPMDVIDADKGSYLRSLFYPSQFATSGTPTPLDDNIYHAAGYYGNEAFAYDAAAGTRQWVANTLPFGSGIVQEGESVAVDSKFVYFFTAGRLFALSRTNGSIAHAIDNPFFSRAGVSYFGTYVGAPMLDGTGRVFTFSDNRGGGQALPLVAFSINSDSVLWRTSRSYVGDPALRAGKLYAIRANSAIVDLIDAADGTVTASIDLGTDKGILTNNLVLTESHLFVSSDNATYAIDLQQPTYPVVWSTQHGGSLAITPDNLLVVTQKAGGIYGYRLN